MSPGAASMWYCRSLLGTANRRSASANLTSSRRARVEERASRADRARRDDRVTLRTASTSVRRGFALGQACSCRGDSLLETVGQLLASLRTRRGNADERGAEQSQQDY